MLELPCAPDADHGSEDFVRSEPISLLSHRIGIDLEGD
jgi:hypothetical protein